MKTFDFFKAIFLRFPFQTILIIVLSLFVASAEMLSLASALPLLGMLLNDGSMENFGFVDKIVSFFGMNDFSISDMLLLIGCLFIAREFFQSLSETAIQWARASVETRFRLGFTKNMLRIGYGSLRKYNMGTMINIMTAQIDTIGVGVRLLGNLMSNAIVGCILIFSTLFLEPTLLLLLAPVGLLSVVVAYYSSKLTRKYARANIVIREQIITSVTEVLKHFKFVKSGSLEALYEAQLKSGILEYLRNVRRNLVVQFLSLSVPQTTALTLVFASLYYYLGKPGVDVQNVLLVIMLLYRASGRIITVQVSWRSLAQHIPAFENVEANSSLLAKDRELYNQGVPVPADFKSIDMNAVGYSYDKKNSALHQMSLSLGKTGMVGVVGPSGAGKTTFVDILTGLIQPTEGEFRIGGIPSTEIDVHDWRLNIAYIPQDSLLMRGTIQDNLLLGSQSRVPDDVIKKVCKDCMVDDFVSRLPDGYDTMIRDLGTSVSGGQRQRILIARALLSEKPIIVLDEGMSAVDVQTEGRLFEALHRCAESRLVILVAHRLEPLRFADRIVVFEDGRVVDDGTFDELLARNGLFSAMVNQWKTIE